MKINTTNFKIGYKLKMKELINILELCSSTFNVEKSVIVGKKRLAKIVIARQFYCYFARKYTNCTLQEIGSFIKKDHATVIHAINSIDNYIYTKDKFIIQKYKEILKEIENTKNNILVVNEVNLLSQCIEL